MIYQQTPDLESVDLATKVMVDGSDFFKKELPFTKITWIDIYPRGLKHIY